jgi:hypothetical protein
VVFEIPLPEPVPVSPKFQFDVAIEPELILELLVKLVATPTHAAPALKDEVGLGAELIINLKLLFELLFIVSVDISQLVSLTTPPGAN